MDLELQEAFGRNLQALRHERGLTQEQMAESMGVNRTYVGIIERAERNLGLQTVARLSRLAGADPFDLLRRPTDRPAGEPEQTAPAPPGDDTATLRAAASGTDPGERRRRARPRP